MTKVVQISNIAPQATKDQMQTLFGYLGKIDDIRLYPTVRDVAFPVQSRICYIRFMESSCVGVAQHLTNTVFIDRAIIVIPYNDGEIPDEAKVIQIMASGVGLPGLVPPGGGGSQMPSHVVNQLQGVPPNHMIVTIDPHLHEAGLPPYPPISAALDASKIEEIRRTVAVTNVAASATSDEIIAHFSKAGEVNYMRIGKRKDSPGMAALIEFREQPSLLDALRMNGTEFKGNTIEVFHATQHITKPQAKSNEAAQREIEEAMKKVKESQNIISTSIDPVTVNGSLALMDFHVLNLIEKDHHHSRSKSRSRSRRRSSSRSRRHRSRSRSRRHRSRSRSRRSRSRRRRSRSRKRSKSKKRSRSRSRSKKERKRSRSSSRSRSHRSDKKSRDRKRDKEDRKKESSISRKEEKRKSKSQSPAPRKNDTEDIADKPVPLSPKPAEEVLDNNRLKSDSPAKIKSPRRISRSVSPPPPKRGSISPRKRSSPSPRRRSPYSKSSRRRRSITPPRKKVSRRRSRSRSITPKKRSPSPVRRRSPYRRKSRSPIRRRSPRRRSRSPRRKGRVGSRRGLSPSPVRRRSRSPRRRLSPSPPPRRRRSPSPRPLRIKRSRSRSPVRRERKKRSSRSPSPVEKLGKVSRDYDEEEKLYGSADTYTRTKPSPPPSEKGDDDMDISNSP